MRSFSIELELRTLSDDGVILFAGNKNLKSYVYLRLDGGKLEFGYSASGTSQSARSSKSVNKGKWHKVTICFSCFNLCLIDFRAGCYIS